MLLVGLWWTLTFHLSQGGELSQISGYTFGRTIGFSLLGGWRESLIHWSPSPTGQNLLIHPAPHNESPSRLRPKVHPPHKTTIFVLKSNKNFIFSLQVMLTLILINVQYLQNVVFSLENGSSSQNHSLSYSHYLIERFPLAKFPISLFLNATRKTLDKGWSLLKFVYLFQVKFHFSVDIFSE